MRWALVLLAVLAIAAAGCLGAPDETVDPASEEAYDDLSEAVFEIEPVEVVRLEMSDGRTMENAVYRPDTNESVPVFINFSPYWGDSAPERGDPFAEYMIEEYVPRGYAVVLSSIRGTGHSEGCFQIGGDLEVNDLKETVEHFAQADWSNGNVLAGGKSYDSTPQNGLVAKDPPEGLVGLFHVSGITDMYRYTYRNGVAYTHGPIFNTYYYGQGIHEYGLPGVGAPEGASTNEDEDQDSLARLLDDVACPELPEMQANGVGSGVHGMKTDYWIERDWNRYVEDSTWDGSIFFVHGLQDWNVKPDHILPWLDRLPEEVDVKGWLHQDVQDGTGHVYPMRGDWNQTMLAWMDHVAKDKDTGIEWTVEAQGSDGTWRESESWPPRQGPTSVQIADASTSATDQGAMLLEGSLSLDNGTQAVRYAGEPIVETTVLVQGNPDPVFTATLYEVAPDGTRTWMNEGVMRGVLANDLASPEPFPQGEEVRVEIPMYPQDDVLEPGHEWVLVLGEEPRYGVTAPAHHQGITYTDAGQVQMPFASLETALEEQPEPVPCFAC